MSFLMAAVTHAPLMASFIVAELTGDWRLLPVLLPLNFAVWRLARAISPRAMYAIASQGPAVHAVPGPKAPGRVK
jgi:H+/Cl- antiporter ClcA